MTYLPNKSWLFSVYRREKLVTYYDEEVKSWGGNNDKAVTIISNNRTNKYFYRT